MALLRHSGIYFLARILAGGASFAIIAAYTRLLDPVAFGKLALALSGVGFFSGLIVYGQLQAMVRYLPSQSGAARDHPVGLAKRRLHVDGVTLSGADLGRGISQWQQRFTKWLAARH
jgi:hypothetical protein